LRIGFIGAGKVGFTLGKYFSVNGLNVSGFYSHNVESAKEASQFTNTRYYETINELIDHSDTLFLTVPDGAISEVWALLKEFSIENKIICHCSGMMSSTIFSGIDQMNAFGYSIHPMFAVNHKLTSYQDISQAFFTIEGSKRYLKTFEELFESLGNPVQIISKQQKTRYHAAAVFASNHVIALFDIATSLLVSCGFSENAANKALEPLFYYNCKAIIENGPVDALTGPVLRGDLITLKSHCENLENDEKKLYLLLSQHLLKIAKTKNNSYDYDEIEFFLKKVVENNETHS